MKSSTTTCLRISTLPLFICALLLSGVAQAQQALETIVVTAQKREQNLQDVGISVTAYTGEQIKEFGVENSVDLASMTPGLQYTVPNAEGSQINFFLRGVGLNDFTDANENPVATYVDDVYHGAMGGLQFQLFDLERAEVLRGPQGTLYGRNTTGGLIHFISKKPTDNFEAYANVGLGSYGQTKYEGAVSGPIPEFTGLTARASMSVDQHDGYVTNQFPGGQDYNSEDSKAGRFQLQYKPSDSFSILASTHGSFSHGNVGAWQHESTKLGGPNGDLSLHLPDNEDFWGTCPGCDAFGYKDTDGDPWNGNFDRMGKVKVNNWGVDGKIEWNWNDIDFVSITGYEVVDRIQQEDTDAGPFPLLIPTFGADTTQITEELRASGSTDRMRWQTGFYYFNNKVDASYLLDLTNLGFVFFKADYGQKTDSWSAFGNVEYDLMPKLTLIGGLRYTQERKTLDYTNVDETGLYSIIGGPLSAIRPNPNDAFVFNKTSVGSLAVQDHDNVTAKAELDWHPTDDAMIYLSFSRGVKSAGFNTGFLDATFNFASNTPATIPYGQETLHAYEAGFKTTLFGGTTRFNASGFYYDYMDFQTFRFELLNQVIFNTDATVYGAEFELQTSPWEGWDFLAGLALLDATAHDIASPSGLEVRDRRMVAAPKVSFNAMARYQWPQWGGTMALIATTNYQSKVFYDIQNSPISEQGSYILGNVRAQYTSGNDHWTASVFVNNVANTAYKTYTFDFTGPFGFNQQAYNKPRWAGGSLEYRWD